MAVVKYSKRPGRAHASRHAFLTDTHVTIKPRFCVALLALALAGAPVGRRSCPVDGRRRRTNPNATRTTLDPHPARRRLGRPGQAAGSRRPKRGHAADPSASQITTHIEMLLNRGDNEEALAMIEKREAEIKDQRHRVQLMFQHARALAGA